MSNVEWRDKWGLVVLSIVSLLALIATWDVLHAQQPDWCKTQLTVQAGLADVQMFRLRCTIQRLDNERHEMTDRAVQAEVEKAVVEAKLAATQAELVDTRKKFSEAEAKLKRMKR